MRADVAGAAGDQDSFQGFTPTVLIKYNGLVAVHQDAVINMPAHRAR
jgi:hypothetical protein